MFSNTITYSNVKQNIATLQGIEKTVIWTIAKRGLKEEMFSKQDVIVSQRETQNLLFVNVCATL